MTWACFLISHKNVRQVMVAHEFLRLPKWMCFKSDFVFDFFRSAEMPMDGNKNVSHENCMSLNSINEQ